MTFLILLDIYKPLLLKSMRPCNSWSLKKLPTQTRAQNQSLSVLVISHLPVWATRGLTGFRSWVGFNRPPGVKVHGLPQGHGSNRRRTRPQTKGYQKKETVHSENQLSCYFHRPLSVLHHQQVRLSRVPHPLPNSHKASTKIRDFVNYSKGGIKAIHMKANSFKLNTEHLPS